MVSGCWGVVVEGWRQSLEVIGVLVVGDFDGDRDSSGWGEVEFFSFCLCIKNPSLHRFSFVCSLLTQRSMWLIPEFLECPPYLLLPLSMWRCVLFIKGVEREKVGNWVGVVWCRGASGIGGIRLLQGFVGTAEMVRASVGRPRQRGEIQREKRFGFFSFFFFLSQLKNMIFSYLRKQKWKKVQILFSCLRSKLHD